MLNFKFPRLLRRYMPSLLAIAILPLLAATCGTQEDAQPNLPFQGISFKANGQLVNIDFNELRKVYPASVLTLLGAQGTTSNGFVLSTPRIAGQESDSLYLVLSVPYLEIPDTMFLNETIGNVTRLEHYTPGTSTRNAQWYSRDYQGSKKTNYIIFDRVDGKDKVSGRFEMILINDLSPAYPDTMRITEGRFNTFETIQQK